MLQLTRIFFTVIVMKETNLKIIKQSKIGLTGYELKLIAMVTMLIDHIGAGIIKHLPNALDENSLMYMLYWTCRLIGRFSFPIYLFLLIEGATKSKHRIQYALRLFIFGLLSEFPFDLCLRHELVDWTHQNVMFTLFIGLLAIRSYEYIHLNKVDFLPAALLKTIYFTVPASYFTYRINVYLTKNTSIKLNRYYLCTFIWIICNFILYNLLKNYFSSKSKSNTSKYCLDIIVLAIFMGLADLCHTDYSSSGILAISLMYLFRFDAYKEFFSGCVALTMLSNPTELMTFAMIPIVSKYNGKRGNKLTLPFYFFYPLHLIIIYLIAIQFGLVE